MEMSSTYGAGALSSGRAVRTRRFRDWSVVIGALCLVALVPAATQIVHHHDDDRFHHDCPVCQSLAALAVVPVVALVSPFIAVVLSVLALAVAVPRQRHRHLWFARAPPVLPG